MEELYMSWVTQMHAARQNIITEQMRVVAEKEKISVETICERVAAGSIVIPANRNHKSLSPEGIGQGLRTKINVNLGISGDSIDYEREMEKVKLCQKYNVEAIMDLSNYGKT
jgi:phosphomethylpyrimidine synthase